MRPLAHTVVVTARLVCFFFALCTAENERRLAPFDARLLRPRMMPALVRFAARFMPREKAAS